MSTTDTNVTLEQLKRSIRSVGTALQEERNVVEQLQRNLSKAHEALLQCLVAMERHDQIGFLESDATPGRDPGCGAVFDKERAAVISVVGSLGHAWPRNDDLQFQDDYAKTCGMLPKT